MRRISILLCGIMLCAAMGTAIAQSGGTVRKYQKGVIDKHPQTVNGEIPHYDRTSMPKHGKAGSSATAPTADGVAKTKTTVQKETSKERLKMVTQPVNGATPHHDRTGISEHGKAGSIATAPTADGAAKAPASDIKEDRLKKVSGRRLRLVNEEMPYHDRTGIPEHTKAGSTATAPTAKGATNAPASNPKESHQRRMIDKHLRPVNEAMPHYDRDAVPVLQPSADGAAKVPAGGIRENHQRKVVDRYIRPATYERADRITEQIKK